jgi:predicted DNA-binding transcriptional regulator AlpA
MPSVHRRHGPRPGNLHIDRRAAQLAAANDDTGPDELLSTPALAEWLGVTVQCLKKWRASGRGPQFVRVGTNTVRYRRGDVLDWLKARTQSHTA